MSPAAYYNEIDKDKGAWLEELIKAGIITGGIVDTRSIKDVHPNDLVGFTRCHFFAGIGVWDYALTEAGWIDDIDFPIWTGSCPCPSFSAAGKGQGFDDPRHLWPQWYPLIRERRPAVILGEQVAAAIRHGWLDLVATDLEAENYAIAPAVLGAHSAGAGHIRQRLWFLAYAGRAPGYAEQLDEPWEGLRRQPPQGEPLRSGPSGATGGMGISEGAGLQERVLLRGTDAGDDGAPQGQGLECGGHAGELAESDWSCAARLRGERGTGAAEGRLRGGLADRVRTGIVAESDRHGRDQAGSGESTPRHDGAFRNSSTVLLAGSRGDLGHPGGDDHADAALGAVGGSIERVAGFWDRADFVYCRDKGGPRWRAVEPGTFPLASGASSRVGRLRGYGDAIPAPTAIAFIEESIAVLRETGVLR